jgi:hypothetical protein
MKVRTLYSIKYGIYIFSFHSLPGSDCMTGNKLSLRTRAFAFMTSHTETLPRHVTAITCCEALRANLEAGEDKTSGGRGRWPKQVYNTYLLREEVDTINDKKKYYARFPYKTSTLFV